MHAMYGMYLAIYNNIYINVFMNYKIDIFVKGKWMNI
jgi:hypothetical protein